MHCHLIIDVGNSLYKFCIIKNHQVVWHQTQITPDKDAIQEAYNKYKFTKAIYSDTRGVNKSDITSLLPTNIPLTELTPQLKLPITINYQTPTTLGKDRIAGASGAKTIFPDTPILIIDVGTAITIDFVSATGAFEGGIISPGPAMRFQALHQFTGKLPLVEPADDSKLTGKSTTEAIQFGVQNGVLFEINEYILRYSNEIPGIKVIITGGDSYLFDKKINYPIFADSFLIPKGLNSILLNND